MKRSYIKIGGVDEPLSQEMVNVTAQAVERLMRNLIYGGTLTVRGNAFMVEAIWNPPSAIEPKMPDIGEAEKGD